MSAFDHLSAKHGMAIKKQDVVTASNDKQELAYIRLRELLTRFKAVAMVVRYGAGKYAADGFGLHFDPRWTDEVSKTEIHNLFWGCAFDLFMARHGQGLPKYRQPSDIIDDELWVKLTS